MKYGGRRAVTAMLLCAAAGPVRADATSLRMEAPGGAGTLRVTNTGAAALEAAIGIEVESLYEGQWRRAGVYFYLVERCAGMVDEAATVTLRPGVPFDVVPWTGWSCSGQCPRPCRANAPFSGTFRPVLTVLPSRTRAVGPVWEMRTELPQGVRR